MSFYGVYEDVSLYKFALCVHKVLEGSIYIREGW